MKATAAAAATLAFLWIGPLPAQETTGDVIGTVTSEDGVALPGVTLRLVDPATGLERTAVSDRLGNYRLVALPPARYRLTGSFDGFQTVTCAIRVDLGRTVTNPIEMKVGAFSDVIEVTGETPLVDVTSTVSGLTASTDELNSRLPVVREVTHVALLAPSTTGGDTAFGLENIDRGYTPGQSSISVGGAAVAETSYQVNGLNITNFRNGVGSSMVPFEFVEELQVKTGGYEAEFGRSTGGVINMVTRSGSNTLRGGISAYFQPRDWQEQEPNTFVSWNDEEDSELLELNASLGGAIVRDRLFFFLFGTYVDSSTTLMELYRGNLWEIADPYWGGKLDWNITPNHRIEGTSFSDQVTVDTTVMQYDREGGVFSAPQTGTMDRGGRNRIIKYTGIFTRDLLLSAQYGSNEFDRKTLSDADLVCPTAGDWRAQGTWTPIGCWVNLLPGPVALDVRDAYRIDLDWYPGRHSLRGGVDYEHNTSSNAQTFSADALYEYFVNGDRFPQLPPDQDILRIRRYRNFGDFDVESRAAYIQDSWAVASGLTVNLGIRYEEFENFNADHEPYIGVDGQWAPRVGAIWDPGEDGRSKLFASYGRYHLPIASNTNIRMASREYFDETWYTFSGGVDPITAEPGRIEEELAYRLISDGEIPDPRATRSDSLGPMYQDELIVGYERTIGANWSVGARFVGREFGEVIEDISLDKALFLKYGADYPIIDLCYNPESPFFLACGMEFRLTNPGNDLSGWVDLDMDGELDRVEFTAAELEYPDPERLYYAVEITFRRRFASNYMVQGSYTWSQSYGNYEGYVNSDLGQDDAGITESFDQAALLDYARGFLPNDRRHRLKIFGAYAWDFGLQVGANAWLQTGRPLNGFGVHPTDPWAQSYGNRAFFNQGEPCPRGCAGTTDDAWSLDLSAKYEWRWNGTSWNLRLDVFNVTNQQSATERSEFAELATGSPNPRYLEPTAHQTPRRVRIGCGVSF